MKPSGQRTLAATCHSAPLHPRNAPNPPGESSRDGILPRHGRLAHRALGSVLATAFFLPAFAYAQGSLDDYERADNLRSMTRNTVYLDDVSPEWFDNGTKFWYRNNLPGNEREFIVVDAVAGERARAFDHELLAQALSEAGVENARGERLPIADLVFQSDLESVAFRVDGNGFRWNLNEQSLEETDAPPAEPNELDARRPNDGPRASTGTGGQTTITFINATGSRVALYWLDTNGARQSYGEIDAGDRRDQNTYAGHVWLVEDADGQELAIFQAGSREADAVIRNSTNSAGNADDEETSNEAPAERWEASVRNNNVYLRDRETDTEYALTDDGDRDSGYSGRIHWSPDREKFVVFRTDRTETRRVPLIESSPNNQLQPRLHEMNYAKPGDPIDITKPHVFHASTREHTEISDDLFPNPWQIRQVRWDDDSSRFTFLYNERGHQVMRVIAVDAESGEATAVINEEVDTFFDWTNKLYAHHVEGTGEIIWQSERDGWNHLYLYDGRSGEVKNQITSGEWVVRAVDRVDAENRQIWFRAGGIYPDQDPYHIHFARIDFDGTGLVILTEGDGTHSVEYSPNREFIIATYSRVDMPPVTELRRVSDGSLVCELERADWSELLETGWQIPERFVAKGRDGETDIYGLIFKPTNFDPARSYPVIEEIYAGPHGAFVPKRFSEFHGSQELVELGFIVVRIDGMGTNHRSKAFHDVAWQNLADSGFPDRIKWIEEAARERPWMDLSRVGIHGVSAGGQSALGGLLFHPEFYHAGVAINGCHDNRMDKMWWNEQWMGYPIGPHYEEQSNVTNAHKLEGEILLIVGELDRNVDPASTMQVVDALIRADKDFELLVMPGMGHTNGGAYGQRRLRDFFVRHLWNAQPRHDLVTQF